MPIYEYKCLKCEDIIKSYISLQNFKETCFPICETCRRLKRKVISKSNFKVKGYRAKNGYSQNKEKEKEECS